MSIRSSSYIRFALVFGIVQLLPQPCRAQIVAQISPAARIRTAEVVNEWVNDRTSKPFSSNIKIAIEGSDWLLIAIKNLPQPSVIYYLTLKNSTSASIPDAASRRYLATAQPNFDMIQYLSSIQVPIMTRTRYPLNPTSITIFSRNHMNARLLYQGFLIDFPELKSIISKNLPLEYLPVELK